MKNRLTSYFSHVMRKLETVTKVKESRNCLPTPNPERKQGHPFSLTVLRIHELCLYSAVNTVVACLFTVSAPQAEGSSLPVYSRVEWDCSV